MRCRHRFLGSRLCRRCESHSLVFSVLNRNITKLNGVISRLLQALTKPLWFFLLLAFWNIAIHESFFLPQSPAMPRRCWVGESCRVGEARLPRGERSHLHIWGWRGELVSCLDEMKFAGKLISAWWLKSLNGRQTWERTHLGSDFSV